MSDSAAEDIDRAEQVAYKWVAPILCVLGLTGSLASLITLHGAHFSARIYTYLKALSVADLGFLIVTIPYLDEIANSKQHDDAIGETGFVTAVYRIYFELSLINSFVSASVFIVLFMTVDR